MRAKPIIIVEDDQDDQQNVKEILQELGVKNELVFFEDCNKAFNYLMSIRTKPFIIISDINLPKMNGIDFKRKIDTTDYLRKKSIPFVFLTTSDSAHMIDEA